MQDSRQFDVHVHISGGALLRVSFHKDLSTIDQLNYLDMHLNGLTAMNV